jgi:methylthioribose-1-phosphate isomerase
VSYHLTRALDSSPVPDFLTSPAALKEHIKPILSYLVTARPTAVNLGTATKRLERTLNDSITAGEDAKKIARDLIAEANAVVNEDYGRNRAMSKLGGDWLVDRVTGNGGDESGLNVLTVCNTGSLATSVRLYIIKPVSLNPHNYRAMARLWA